MLDKIDCISFLATSFVVAELTDVSGVELVAMQTLWFAFLWIGKTLVDYYVERRRT